MIKEARQPGVPAAGLQLRQEFRGQGRGFFRVQALLPQGRGQAGHPGQLPPRARVSRPRWMISPRSRGISGSSRAAASALISASASWEGKVSRYGAASGREGQRRLQYRGYPGMGGRGGAAATTSTSSSGPGQVTASPTAGSSSR